MLNPKKTSLFTSFLCLGSCLANAVYAEPATLTAGDMSYDEKNEIVTATGDVHIESSSGALKADKITYDRKNDAVVASGNITYVDKNNIAVFSDEMTLSGDLRTAAINSLKIRIGKGGPVLTALKAEKPDDDTYSLKNAAYSPCKICDDKEPAWKIRAADITYSKQKENIEYRDAILDVYGKPVVYLPYFRHPVGDQTRQSGFLMPRFGRSTSKGEEMTLSYYKAISPHRDATVRTRFMSRRGVQGMIEHRAIGSNGELEMRGSIISDNKTSTIRSHFAGTGEYIAEPGFRVGFDSKIASDDTYMDDFFGENYSFLSSSGYVEKATKDTYFALSSTWYQDIRDGKDPAETLHALPRFQVEKVLPIGGIGSNLTLSADVVSLHRSEGTRSRRLITEADLSKAIHTDDGSLFALSAKIRGDVYHVDGNNGERGFAFRGLPEASVTWEKPYSSAGGTHTFTPKAMLVGAPRGGNPTDIPNEDSVAYELDSANLFDTNRYAGLDRVETGNRLIYGIDNHWGTPTNTRWRFFFGQSYRFFDDSTLPTLGGTGTKGSDWVGWLQTTPAPWFRIYNRFRLDNSDLTAKRLDSEIRLGQWDETNFTINHTFLDGGPEEITLKAKYEFNDNFAIEAQSRQDLTDGGKQLLSEGTLTYTQGCYEVSFTARRRGFNNRNVPPSTDFLLNLELLFNHDD
jgi:LPS-assembly protein